MTAWMGAKKRGPVHGTCYLCRKPADGPLMFQTRFCYMCFTRGMDLEEEQLLNSKYALVRTLYRIKTTYDDIVIDVQRAIQQGVPTSKDLSDKGIR